MLIHSCFLSIFYITVPEVTEMRSLISMHLCRNAHKVKGHPSLHKGGCNEVHDIEDLVKVGQLVKGWVLLLF